MSHSVLDQFQRRHVQLCIPGRRRGDARGGGAGASGARGRPRGRLPLRLAMSAGVGGDGGGGGGGDRVAGRSRRCLGPAENYNVTERSKTMRASGNGSDKFDD